MEHYPAIAQKLAERGLFLEGGLSENQVWQYLRTQNLTRSKASKCNMSRFFGSIRRVRDLADTWPIEAFERTYDAIESDHLGNKNLFNAVQLASEAPAGDAGDAVGPTNPHRLSVDAKTIRSMGNNAPGITVVTLSFVTRGARDAIGSGKTNCYVKKYQKPAPAGTHGITWKNTATDELKSVRFTPRILARR